MKRAIVSVGAILCIACGASHRAAGVDSAPRASARTAGSPLDAATIQRLCANPARVLPGSTGCVLRDQSLPREFYRLMPPR